MPPPTAPSRGVRQDAPASLPARPDADAARDELQAFVIETLGHPEGIGVVDETGFLKKAPGRPV